MSTLSRNLRHPRTLANIGTPGSGLRRRPPHITRKARVDFEASSMPGIPSSGMSGKPSSGIPKLKMHPVIRGFAVEAHLGFKKTAAKIASKEGISPQHASAILASSSRHASTAAHRHNPLLNRVKG